MPAQNALYQEVEQQMLTITAEADLRITSVRRLALLVTGIIAAKSCVLTQVAAELEALKLTQATWAESITRRLRRTLNDPALTANTCYAPVLPRVIDWPAVLRGSRRVVLIVDESSKEDEIHLVRISLAYWGGSLPLAWAVWEQNQPLPAGHYWATVDAILDRIAALLPAGLEVVVVADRAYDIPAFIDRISAKGWHWVVRCKAGSSLRWRDAQGREWALRALVERHLPSPGRRWKARGQVFKAAGWRVASVVGLWAPGQAERLVVLSDLPAQWAILRLYGRRFWIEPGFRNDKSRGWQWEDSQVQGVAHHERLLLGLAWASLVTLCLGVQEAQRRVDALAERPIRVRAGRPAPAQPQHARESLFTLGLRRVRHWLYQAWAGAFPWRLADLDTDSWTAQWQCHQAYRLIFQTVRP
jgi:hypothetical protein